MESEAMKKVKQLSDDLVSKQQQTKTLDAAIAQIEGLKREKAEKIKGYKQRMKNIENEMANLRESHLDNLRNFGVGLSAVNEKLHYTQIQKYTQKDIDLIIMNALKAMKAPPNIISQQLKANKKSLNFKEIQAMNAEIKKLQQMNGKFIKQTAQSKDKQKAMRQQMKAKHDKMKRIGLIDLHAQKRIAMENAVLMKKFDWIKNEFLPKCIAFKQRLESLKDDPRFAENAKIPFSEATGWKVQRAKECVTLYHREYGNCEAKLNGLCYDLYLEKVRNERNKTKTAQPEPTKA